MSHRILVSDKLSDRGLDVLRQADGFELDYRAGIPADELADALQGADGLLVRSRTKVLREVFAKVPSLKVVGRAGIGVDNIDLVAATDHGVVVMNAPSGNALTTAEHTIAMMFALARHIPQADASMKAGRWDKKKYMGVEIEDKTLALIGAGNIGGIVGKKAAALGMRVLAVDPFLTPARAAELGVTVSPLLKAVEAADFITVHVPKIPATTNMINADLLRHAKDGVRILNVARGGIVDEEAVYEALESGKVAGAAFDVFVTEPPTDRRLADHPGVVSTPHLGASTFEAQVKVAQAIAEQVRDFLAGSEPRNCVNPTVFDK